MVPILLPMDLRALKVAAIRFLSKSAWFFPIVVVLLFFLPELLAGKALVSQDSTNLIYVLRRWHIDQIFGSGHVPLWNAGLFSGIEHGADPQMGIYSPLLWLYMVFSGYLAHQLYTVVLVAAGGLGLALYLARLVKNRWVAVYVSVLYTLGGVVLSYAHNVAFLAGVCLFPWVLHAYLRFLERKTLGRFGLLALMLAWVVFEGDPVGVFWLSGYLLVDAGWRSLQARSWEGIYVVLAGFLAVLLTAVVLLPPFDALGESERALKVPFQEASLFSLPAAQLLQWFVPSLWGRSHNGTFWGHGFLQEGFDFTPRFWFESIYLGLPVLVLIALGCWSCFRGRKNRWLLLFPLFFVLVALGDGFVLHGFLYDWFPSYGRLRFPAKFFGYANLFLFCLAAVGLADLVRSLGQADGERRMVRVLAAVALLFGVSALVSLFVSAGPTVTVPSNMKADVDWAGAKTLLSKNVMSAGALGACTGLVLLWSWWRRRAGHVTGRGLIGWLVVIGLLDGLLWAPPSRLEDLRRIDQPSKVGAILNGRAFDEIRVLRDANLDRFPGVAKSIPRRESLGMNFGLLEGIGYAFGYEPTVPGRYDRLAGALVFREFETWARVLGITHVLSTFKPVPSQLSGRVEKGTLDLIATFPDENVVVLERPGAGPPVELYERTVAVTGADEALHEVRQRGAIRDVAVLGRGEILFRGAWQSPEAWEQWFARVLARVTAGESGTGKSPGRVVRFDRSSSSVRLELRLDADALVEVKQTFHPGWKAWADGVEVPIVRADYINQAVFAERSTRVLVLEFDPPGLAWGMWLSLGTASLMLVAWLAVGMRCLLRAKGRGHLRS